ncbi:MAG: ABC transporter ATP-binding protein [Candidatus Improbicoccus pseudotrichonymphae]|uniref:ABC transporter ATP-binding protein n=1 Tax=Candidatus Improbicoccus pseudotrichonymphae TaxID=3033792 RepID=A0AA48KYA1_9FIRM|nr:MAG: ABC transporter ATP-binding protein [Candidatus Improbicoccus pseudotrichonymphae]
MYEKFKKLISYYKPYKNVLILDLLLLVLSDFIVIFIPVICNYITNQVFQFEKTKAIKITVILSILVILLSVSVYFCKRYIEYQGSMFAFKMSSDIEIEIFEHLQKQNFSFFDEQKTGKLVSYITNDAYNLANVIKRAPEVALSFTIRFLAAFVFFFIKNVFFAFILLLVFICVFIFILYFSPKVQKITANSREIFSDLIAYLEENLSGIKTVQSFTNENIEIERFRSNNDIYIKERNKICSLSSIFRGGIFSFAVSLIPIVTIAGAFFMINGNINAGDFIVYLLYIDILLGPIFSFVDLNEFLQEGIVGFNRINNILSSKSETVDSPNSIVLKSVRGKIEFKNIYFKYGESDKNVFKNLNFSVEPGECIALVGSSGSGKTTICNLIPRFYDLINGEILIDGINIKDVKLKNLRQNIGFVQQDTFLFSGTIKENICYGKPEASEGEIIKAAKDAYAHDFIIGLQEGYNTHIGHKGLKLSGGQKQRLAIARVFLKNPPILIFDEATSNLDNESERYIQKSMEKLTKNRTTIVIAHRLTTIINANKIFVILDGKIVEKGTHKELLKKNGTYAKFYNFF